ncbi:hypothetical protein PENTCL1PPCAC_10002, partial [Pristionchus entomophagus]
LENYVILFAVVMTTVHFLFFCRAKFVGPFVLMIYTIIATDLTRFILYLVFLIEFSQSFYTVFFACETAVKSEEFKEFGDECGISAYQEAIIPTFNLNIGEFNVFYRQLAL